MGPGCRKTVKQNHGSGRRRLYCSEKCGARSRKIRSSTPKSRDNDDYAATVAEEYVQHTVLLAQMVRESRTQDALKLVVECEKDWKDLRAAVVQQARDQKMKASAIAEVLHISPDTLIREVSANRSAKRRQNRAPQPPSSKPTPAGTPLLSRRHPQPAQPPPQRPEGGFPAETDNGPPAQGPAATLARALSHLHRLSDRTLRALSEEADVHPSYVSRVLSGERLPSWKVTRKLVAACDGDPEELRPLWNTARGYRVVQPTSLPAALRGLHLAAALPEPALISARTPEDLSENDIIRMLNGSWTPDWRSVGHLVSALHGEPETVRPLWEATQTTHIHTPSPAVPPDNPPAQTARNVQASRYLADAFG
jgi:transcriptional regulator with XRE-family HTH domain